MTLLPDTDPNESDAARTKRLSRGRGKTKAADHETGNDELTDVLNAVWDSASEWARAIQLFMREHRGATINLEHARDILARVAAKRPMNWVTIIRSRPSFSIVATMIENLENEDSRIFIVPDRQDLLPIFGDEAAVTRALSVLGVNACRRKWYTRRAITPAEHRRLAPPRATPEDGATPIFAEPMTPGAFRVGPKT